MREVRLTNQNYIHEEIKSTLKFREFLLPLCSESLAVPSPKITNIKTYKTIILPLVFYATWSVTLREEHRLRVSENRVLRRIFEPKGEGRGEVFTGF
jgi:hypothetical protein